jgi:hypothetical protein
MLAMKSMFSFLGGILLGGVVFGAAGVFFGIILEHSGEPVVVVHNLSRSSIPNVRIETDVGESYAIDNLLTNESRRIRISGRDKALWIVAVMPTGVTNRSAQVYVSSQGKVFGVVSEESVAIDYEL